VKARFTSQAETELAAAIDYYELSEIEDAKSRIEMHPLAWSKMSSRTRKCRTHRFPFGLLYEVRPNEILVTAVMDLRRDPVRWEEFLS
jgi:hypothetical protein